MFGKKTVDEVLVSFNRAIDDLNKIAADSATEGTKQRAIAAEALAAADAAETEKMRANSVADKIAALIA